MTRSQHGRFTMLTFVLTMIAILTAPALADAQSFGDRLKKRAEEAAKRKVEERAEQRAGEATNKAMNAAEGTIKCVFTDERCIARAKKEGKEVVLVDAQGNAVDGAGAPAAGAPVPAANANYDFRPGDRVLLATDFAEDEVGDFPRRLELKTGNMEVVEWQGRRFLRATSQFEFQLPLPEQLPERFTLEFDLRATYHAHSQSHVKVDFGSGDKADYASCGPYEAGLYGRGGSERKAVYDLGSKQLGAAVIRCRIMVDGKYAKMYVNETRVANHPNTALGRARAITISGWVTDPNEIMLGDIRVAAGGKDLYDALAETGRVTAEGILFDTGSDRLRPESGSVLAKIAAMLTAHPELRLTIEGHTDNVGDARANQTLSEKRAAAVKAYLVATHGVDAGRLASAGFGASRPTSSNDTAEGRQKNRRVELVRN